MAATATLLHTIHHQHCGTARRAARQAHCAGRARGGRSGVWRRAAGAGGLSAERAPGPRARVSGRWSDRGCY
jgi:hypothetical protein